VTERRGGRGSRDDRGPRAPRGDRDGTPVAPVGADVDIETDDAGEAAEVFEAEFAEEAAE